MDQLRDIFVRASQFIAALAGLIFVPLFILGNSIFNLWTPTIAIQVHGVFHLICISGYVVILTASISNNIMVGLGKIRQFTIYTTTRNIVFGISCFILIRPLGLLGAGWALIITCIVDIVYFFIVIYYYLQIKSIGHFLLTAFFRPFLLTIIIAIIAFSLSSFSATWVGLILIGIIISVAFIFFGFVIGVFGTSEKRAIQEILLIFKK